MRTPPTTITGALAADRRRELLTEADRLRRVNAIGPRRTTVPTMRTKPTPVLVLVLALAVTAGAVLATVADAAPPSCNGKEATLWQPNSGPTGYVGTERDDFIVANTASNSIRGGGGSDTICAGAGNDVISGGLGNDTIFAGEGNDQLRGDGGADSLRGGPGDDQFWGGLGRDVCKGELGGLDRVFADSSCEKQSSIEVGR